MSDVAVLDAAWTLDFSFMEDSEFNSNKSTWHWESDKDLAGLGVSLIVTGEKTLYETPEVLYYKMIVSSNYSPFSVLFASRSEVAQDNPTLSGIHPETIRAYEDRLGFIEKIGLTEGIELNINSETDFWEFIDASQFSRQAELVFIGEGNIRAIWEDEDENFLGLHFLGNRRIIYVVFKQHPDGKDITTETGVESFEGTKEKIFQFGLTHLVNS